MAVATIPVRLSVGLIDELLDLIGLSDDRASRPLTSVLAAIKAQWRPRDITVIEQFGRADLVWLLALANTHEFEKTRRFAENYIKQIDEQGTQLPRSH